MSALAPLDIFRAGTHTDVAGRTLSFAAADLDATAAAYDPAKHEAPLVVGHPALDAPAYGWVKALARDGEVLRATPDQVEAQFAEWVNAGRYKKISASFWLPDAPGNPAPGIYSLRHVGFLGAAAPAVKGLRAPSFAGDQTGIVTLEFSEWGSEIQVELWRNLREFFIEKFGKEQADSVIPSLQIDILRSDIENERIRSAESAISQEVPIAMSEPTVDFAAREAELNQREAALAEREAALAKAEADRARAAAVAFAETQAKAGTILPRQQAGLVELLLALPAAPLEFADGDQTVSTEPRAWLEQFVAGLPVRVDFAERSAAAPAASAPAPVLSRAAFDALPPAQRAKHVHAGGTIRD
ncbi:MAG: peptidase [Candidatus Competibacter sp.]|nr:peptidase [Candidatus Competibacter sp.]MDS4059829.1 peptidase [Candidatus Contendobacter sp.]